MIALLCALPTSSCRYEDVRPKIEEVGGSARYVVYTVLVELQTTKIGEASESLDINVTNRPWRRVKWQQQ